MKNLDSLLKQCDDLVVAFREFTEGLRLPLKYFSDGFNSVAGPVRNPSNGVEVDRGR
jgi:hypothetical protein